MTTILKAARLFTPVEQVEDPLVFVDGGRVTEISSAGRREIPGGARVVDFSNQTLAPGYIDMHIHGAAGHDVMEADAESLPAVERLLHRHGVTTYFPTTITAPVEITLEALARLADAIDGAKKSPHPDRARPVGIHLEGPFISHARPGVHPVANLLPPFLETFDRFWEAARGHIKVLTIAPELAGARALIAEATRRGVCVSLGHSDANLEQAQAGIAAGARHATHTFNAMRPLQHRDPGITGAALIDSRLSADIIADGIHVDPLMVRLFLRAKGVESAVLVTDATAATGMPNGQYRLGSLLVEVQDGQCLSYGRLAGSVLTMDQAVRNVVTFANWDLQNAVRLATLNPARTTGLAGDMGTLAAGMIADLVVLNQQGEVMQTIVAGNIPS
jgi:N-acetylglucosamine-6-phosphate deacetylase